MLTLGCTSCLFKNSKKSGEEGHRSPYLAHAKRALYHLSYVPAESVNGSMIQYVSGVGFEPTPEDQCLKLAP